MGMQGRSGPQIDADIRALRDEWEGHERSPDNARPVKE